MLLLCFIVHDIIITMLIAALIVWIFVIIDVCCDNLRWIL